MQTAVKVEETPGVTVAGETVKVHEGVAKGSAGGSAGVGAEFSGGLQAMVVLPFESEIE